MGVETWVRNKQLYLYQFRNKNKEQEHKGHSHIFSMVLEISKTYIDHWKLNNVFVL